MMCSAGAERDVRFAREKRNTSHHFAAKPQNITMPQGIASLAPFGANITIERPKLSEYNGINTRT